MAAAQGTLGASGLAIAPQSQAPYGPARGERMERETKTAAFRTCLGVLTSQ